MNSRSNSAKPPKMVTSADRQFVVSVRSPPRDRTDALVCNGLQEAAADQWWTLPGPLNDKSVTGLQEAISLASMAGPFLRRRRPPRLARSHSAACRASMLEPSRLCRISLTYVPSTDLNLGAGMALSVKARVSSGFWIVAPIVEAAVAILWALGALARLLLNALLRQWK